MWDGNEWDLPTHPLKHKHCLQKYSTRNPSRLVVIPISRWSTGISASGNPGWAQCQASYYFSSQHSRVKEPALETRIPNTPAEGVTAVHSSWVNAIGIATPSQSSSCVLAWHKGRPQEMWLSKPNVQQREYNQNWKLLSPCPRGQEHDEIRHLAPRLRHFLGGPQAYQSASVWVLALLLTLDSCYSAPLEAECDGLTT